MTESPVIQRIKGYCYSPRDKEAVLRLEIYTEEMAHPQMGCAFFFRPVKGLEYSIEMKKGDLEHGGKE